MNKFFEKELTLVFKGLASLFRECEDLLVRHRVHRPAATVLARGGGGYLNSVIRDYAKSKFSEITGVATSRLHPEDREVVDDFIKRISDIVYRTIQNYYTTHDEIKDQTDDDIDTWLRQHFSEIDVAFVYAISGYARSELYNIVAKPHIEPYLINEHANKILKEFAFATLLESFHQSVKYANHWLDQNLNQ